MQKYQLPILLMNHREIRYVSTLLVWSYYEYRDHHRVNLWEVATAFAEEQKVFVTSGSQAPYAELLASGTKELVCIDENCSIEGVKVRQNYKERPNSKDLIVDVTGDIPVEQAAKVLKKHGALLSFVSRDWAEYFAEVKAVAWSEIMSDETGSEFQRLSM